MEKLAPSVAVPDQPQPRVAPRPKPATLPVVTPPPPKPRDPMEYDPDLSVARASTVPTTEGSDEITAVLEEGPENTAADLDPAADAANDALLRELEESSAAIAPEAQPEPPPPPVKTTIAVPPIKPATVTPTVTRPSTTLTPPPAPPPPAAKPVPAPIDAPVATSASTFRLDQSQPGSGASIVLEDFRDASRSDWSEGRRLDTFFGTPPEKIPGPSAEKSPDPGPTSEPDVSVIRIRPEPEEESKPVSLPPTAPPAAIAAAPSRSALEQPTPAGEETAEPSFLRRDADPVRSSLLPFGERSGSSGDASVYGTRSLTGPRPDSGPLGRRALAGLCDFGLILAVTYGLVRAAVWLASNGKIYGSVEEWAALVGLPALLMAAVFAVTFQSLFLLLAGRTPGMALAGLDFGDDRPAAFRLVLRSIILTLEVLPLGLGLLLLYRGAGWWLHDRIAGARPERRT